MSNNSIRLIDWTLSSATTPGQSETGSNDNKEVLHIPQSSYITGALPSVCFAIYPEHSLGESYPPCRDVVGVFYSLSWLGSNSIKISHLFSHIKMVSSIVND